MDLATQNVLCKCADRLIQMLILLPVPLQQHLQPQLVQLLVQLALPAQQQHPLFSQTQLHLLYQQPEWNMPICSAINHHQETRAVDLIMEEGCCEPIVETCRTTEDRCGQEPLFALRPLLQANCQPQPREWHWHWIGWGEKDRISKQWKWYASSSVHCWKVPSARPPWSFNTLNNKQKWEIQRSDESTHAISWLLCGLFEEHTWSGIGLPKAFARQHPLERQWKGEKFPACKHHTAEILSHLAVSFRGFNNKNPL